MDAPYLYGIYMNDDEFLDKIQDDEEELYRSYVKPVNPVVAKIFAVLAIISGIAIGVCLFLFFLTIFIYFFLPLLGLLFAWLLFKRWQFNREWRKTMKDF